MNFQFLFVLSSFSKLPSPNRIWYKIVGGVERLQSKLPLYKSLNNGRVQERQSKIDKYMYHKEIISIIVVVRKLSQ